MSTRKKIIFLLLVSIIINTSVVYSSWLDMSRYETGGYSFKIPEGFHFTYGPGSDDNEYLVDEAGGAYTDFGSNRISIRTLNKDLESEFNKNYIFLHKYNNSISFYTQKLTPWASNHEKENMTIGLYKTSNGTNIVIYLQNSWNRKYDNQKIENDIDIILGMFESVKED